MYRFKQLNPISALYYRKAININITIPGPLVQTSEGKPKPKGVFRFHQASLCHVLAALWLPELPLFYPSKSAKSDGQDALLLIGCIEQQRFREVSSGIERLQPALA